MEETLELERKEILDNAIYESELSDLKQHADKMIRGFENFNNFSSNRAIWELVQNACDLSEECEIIIDYRNNGFSFSHNGKPFTTKSLISLIKQVSGKYGEESEIAEVGKYGTGFLTTHSFGRKFKINSLLKTKSNFLEINDFLIDRSPKDWVSLADNIRIQKNRVFQLIKEGKFVFPTKQETSFTFLPETDQEFVYINESLKDLSDYIPIVLTINNRLKQVTILTDNESNIFKFGKKIFVENDKNINLFRTSILKNGYEQIVYSIIDDEYETEIILPVNENYEVFEFSERIARLFLYYPLIGSEDFGINFIINSKQFLPTEPRNGIHLQSNKDQVKDQEENNRRIIQKAGQLIFDFLKSNILNVNNPLLYAKINFKRNSDNELLNKYFSEIQTEWSEEFKTLPIVETLEGFKTVNDTCFYDEELLNCTEHFDDIYLLTSKFFKNIPVKNKIELWSEYVSEWTNDTINFIGHEDLVLSISKEKLSNFDGYFLNNYYKTLINKEKTHFFSEKKLLPNIAGEFRLLNHFLTPKDLTPTLIEIGKVLIPNWIDKLIHEDYYFNFHFDVFNRKSFSINVKTNLDEMQATNYIYLSPAINENNYQQLDKSSRQKLELVFFEKLLSYCKLTNNISSQSKPTSLVKKICNYYSIDDDLILLPNLEKQEDNLDTRSVRKILVQIFFNIIELHSDQWISNNIELLFEIANCNEDSLKDVFANSKIYPNQNNQLKSIGNLKRDIDVLEKIKDLYLKVIKTDIRDSLIYKELNGFIPKDQCITNKWLTNQIEDIFFNTDINNINSHPFKADILDIISKIRNKEYAELFPRLDDKKANLMLEIVTNEATKDDIFSIVTLNESQLNRLGKLVQEENFESLLNKASELLEQQQQKDSDFRHKYEIGTNIENLIREKLNDDLHHRITFDNKKTIDAADIQGGQDIIILLDQKPFYYIEVKSRWSSVNSVAMSKLQLQRAVEENEIYALCSVDITRYTGSNNRYNLPIEEIVPLTKFVTNIGKSIKPLIEENLIAERNQDKLIHLVDYRGVIPQDIIQKGNNFHTFIDSLIVKLNSI